MLLKSDQHNNRSTECVLKNVNILDRNGKQENETTVRINMNSILNFWLNSELRDLRISFYDISLEIYYISWNAYVHKFQIYKCHFPSM